MEGARVLRDYFVRMQEKDDQFYYVMDVDDSSRLRNVFWADAGSRFGRMWMTNFIM